MSKNIRKKGLVELVLTLGLTTSWPITVNNLAKPSGVQTENKISQVDNCHLLYSSEILIAPSVSLYTDSSLFSSYRQVFCSKD